MGRKGPKRYYLVLGLDFGTTFTGISYALSRREGIHSVNEWPSSDLNVTEEEKQVPSIAAYPGSDAQSFRWGYQVTPDLGNRCAFMKLHLDKNAPPTPYDSPHLQNEIENGYFRLPPDKVAHIVTQEYLTQVFKYAKEFLSMKLGRFFLDVTRVEFWITKPASSGDEAQHITLEVAKKAAKNAGFEDNGLENFFGLVGESEAAVAAIVLEMGNDAQPGKNILICDAGGGQVDITVYKLTAVSPELNLEQMTVTQGPKYGATQIDSRLHALMELKFKENFKNLPAETKAPGSAFMKDFEFSKRKFDKPRAGHPQSSIRLRLTMKNAKSGLYRPSGHVVLTEKHMDWIFADVVKKIIELISKQVEAANGLSDGKVTDIALVGGLGDSPYLRSKLYDWWEDGNQAIKLRISKDRYEPTHDTHSSWGAIARGAVSIGSERAIISRRLSQTHYGIACALPFDKMKGDDMKDACMIAGGFYCAGCVWWLIKRGTEISREIIQSDEFFNMLEPGRLDFTSEILSSRAEEAPRKQADNTNRVNRINVALTTEDLTGSEMIGGYYKFIFSVEVVFGEREGTVNFRVRSGNKILGTREVTFLPQS